MVDRPDSSLALNDEVGDQPTSQVSKYARSNYVWPYASGPSYGTVAATDYRKAGVLHTGVGSFDLSEIGSRLPDELKAKDRVALGQPQYFVVQLDPETMANGSRADAEAKIAETGGAIVDNLPVAAMVVRATPATKAALESAYGVIAVQPYHPAFKLDPTIGRTPLADPVKAVSEVYDLDLKLFRGEDSQAVAQTIAGLGGNVTAIYPDSLRVEIHRSKLAAVAGVEAVSNVWEHLAMKPHGEETTTTIQTGNFNGAFPGAGAVPYHDAGILGDGQVLMVLDSGIQFDAADLSDTDANPGTPGTDVGNAGPGGVHRKVLRYESTNQFGGNGDVSGCDAIEQGGTTHGHIVSATALGNATDNLPGFYGTGTQAEDTQGSFWDLDGVAPGAKLVAFDGQPTPASVSCADPLQDTISPGDLYSGGMTGSLGSSYTLDGARVANFSWGADSNTYTINASDVDTFIADKLDAMVFISAGNAASNDDNNGAVDSGSLGTPATTKNGLAIGSSNNTNEFANDLTNPEGRSGFSSTGPTPSGRIAPQLMAPGADGGTMGVPSEFACRTSDNDSAGAVECDIAEGLAGTSFAAPAAAGSALLVRDYFAQGFYPSGALTPADAVPNISGALLKAVLIASADFMTGGGTVGNVCFAPHCHDHRVNITQGWGRIQLDNALPLELWPPSPSGLVIVDGGIDGNPKDISGLTGTIDAIAGETQAGVIKITDDSQELRIALTWIEEAGDALVNDINLTLTGPSGQFYQGNYFTDDDDGDGEIDLLAEDCGAAGEPATPNGERDAGGFSLQACVRANVTLPVPDSVNPIEAIVLSPDPDGDEETDDGQIEVGDWTVTVQAPGGGSNSAQRYALVVTGGVSIQSSVRFNKGSYVCNDPTTIVINEFSETGDLNPSAFDAGARTTVRVFDSSMVEVDSEAGSDLGFTKPDPAALRFEATAIPMSDNLARDPGNGVLDIRSGDTLEVTYQDVDAGGLPDPAKVRKSFAQVDCRVRIGFGSITFAQFGEDATFFINGGCERNARDQQEFGFPDRYMDAGENIIFQFAFNSNESADLNEVVASLRCVEADDTLADEDCLADDPVGPNCLNPTRSLTGPNAHTACSGLMTIANSPMKIGLIPAGSALSSNFNIKMAPSIPGNCILGVDEAGCPEVELVLEVTAETSGKTAEGVAVSRQRLNVDANEILYSTDYPTGDTEFRDGNGNELIQNPTTNLGDFLSDYRFETVTYGDLTAGGTKNMGIGAPWHFDTHDGNFVSGLGAATDESTIADTIAQWGEDKNFNGIDDKRCNTNFSIPCDTKTDCVNAGFCTPNCSCDSLEQRDPADNVLDKNWNTLGGCGWQTLSPGTCSGDASVGCYTNQDCIDAGAGNCTGGAQTAGGIWHTGTIRTPVGACLADGLAPGRCQTHETVSGDTGQRLWFELLLTPELEKVSNDDETRVEIVNFAWNQAVDLQDSNVAWSWEVDTDTESLEPADLVSDLGLLNFGFGSYGAIINENNAALTNGFSVFAPTDSVNSNGTVGNNRQGRNNCEFTNNDPGDPGILGLAKPDDDDLNNGYCAEGFNNQKCQVNTDCGVCLDNGAPLNPPETCFVDGDCSAGTCFQPAVCTFDNGTVDEYVTPNGPIRNMDLFAFNGPDMRFTTLEDIYGPTGTRFQAGIGMLNFEKAAAADPDPITGYGIGVDDAVFSWKEINLVGDVTECAPGGGGQLGGECASIELETTNFYEGRSLLTISVLDSSPTVNNCNDDFTCDDNADGLGDGVTVCNPFLGTTGCSAGVQCKDDYNDAGDDLDCNNNGIPDVRVEAQTEDELAPGERVTLDCTANTGLTCDSSEFRGTLPVSVAYDVPGVLFGTVRGGDLPTALVTYLDNDDGTGSICTNDVDPAAQGEVQAATALFVTAGNVIVNLVEVVSDSDDNDGFADTDELVELSISIINRTGVALTNVTARLASNDPKIDCIVDSFASIGSMADKEEKVTNTTGDNFQFRVGGASVADRATLGLNDLDELAATFSVVISADQFDTAAFPQEIVLDLDLDASGGGAPVPGGYFESFEVSAGLASFTTMNLDLGGQGPGDPFVFAQGKRCQYSDPDWMNSNNYNEITDCHIGPSGDIANTDAYFWQVHQTTDIDGGRAYDGTRSLYMGVFGAAADEHTTPLSNLEAVRMDAPVNLSGTDSAELSIIHQVSFMDTRIVNARPGRTADRGAVQLQLADGGGNPVGNWIKLEPFQNVYDQQAEDNYFNCMFDPNDDGTSEDDFDDPSDPDRRLGPSTLCFPEQIFGNIGNTFDPFNGDLGGTLGGLTPEGPALEGNLGVGTWIESKFNLQRFKGRSVRLRFVNSALKVATFVTYEALFANNPNPGDDGWWIDAISVSNTIDSPVSITTDDATTTPAPACNSFACNSLDITPALDVVDPDPFGGSLGSPGLAVELSAAASGFQTCLDGVLQFRFSDNSGVLRDWTDNPGIVVAPIQTTTYTVDVRCSSDTACSNTATNTIFVDCPKSGALLTGPFSEEIVAAKAGSDVTFSWTTPGDADIVGGLLASYPTATIFDSVIGGNSITVTPEAGSTFFVVRDKGEFCNNGGSWNTAGGAQVGNRDADLP